MQAHFFPPKQALFFPPDEAALVVYKLEVTGLWDVTAAAMRWSG